MTCACVPDLETCSACIDRALRRRRWRLRRRELVRSVDRALARLERRAADPEDRVLATAVVVLGAAATWALIGLLEALAGAQ